MSNPTAAWALLTARAQSLSGAAAGGRPSLTAAEVARCLQGLKRGPFLMGMAINSGAVDVLRELEYCMWKYVRDLAEGLIEDADGKLVKIPNFNPWPLSHGQAYCRRLAGLAIYEALIQRPVRCSKCLGRGYIVVHGQEMQCVDSVGADGKVKVGCNNSGGKPMSSKMRSELACIPWTSWRDGWNWRYEVVLAEATGWHGDAMRHLDDGLEGLRSVA